MVIKKCGVCGKVASNLIIGKHVEVILCGNHLKALEVYLDKEIEPLTTERNLLSGLFLSYRP